VALNEVIVEAQPSFHMIQRTSEPTAWEVIVEALDAILEALNCPLHVGFQAVTVDFMLQA